MLSNSYIWLNIYFLACTFPFQCQDQLMEAAAVAAIAPQFIAIVIELLRTLLRSTTKDQNLYGALKMDLEFIEDISKKIENSNSRNIGYLMTWMNEATRLVNDAKDLLEIIERQNDRPQKKQRNELNDLRKRCDHLSKHNNTILRLIKGNRWQYVWLVCIHLFFICMHILIICYHCDVYNPLLHRFVKGNNDICKEKQHSNYFKFFTDCSSLINRWW